MLNTLKPVMLVAVMALSPLAGHASTIMNDGATVTVAQGEVYNYLASSSTSGVDNLDFADKKLEFTFSSNTLPSSILSVSSFLSVQGTITNAIMEWMSGGVTLATASLGQIVNGTPGYIGADLQTTLATGANPQMLRISWTSLAGSVDANVQVVAPAAVPIPAAGGLLLLALGGLGLARRRKSV